MLRVEDLAVRYGQIVAVRGATFEAHAGEVTTLVGPNGAGKTSTLAAIAGMVAASGRVHLGASDLTGRAPEQRAAAGLGYVRDGRSLFGRLSVVQNLTVGATTVRGRGVARAAVDAMLQRFPLLAERAQQRAGTLSGGEAQVLQIARALVSSPSALLVDEPFQGLSDAAREIVLDALRGVANDGAVVLLAVTEPIADARALHVHAGSLAEVVA